MAASSDVKKIFPCFNRKSIEKCFGTVEITSLKTHQLNQLLACPKCLQIIAKLVPELAGSSCIHALRNIRHKAGSICGDCGSLGNKVKLTQVAPPLVMTM